MSDYSAHRGRKTPATRPPARITLNGRWEGEVYAGWDFPPDIIEQWNAMSGSCGDEGIFISYDWFRIWWEAFGGEGELFVAVLKKDGRTRAVFPCRRSSDRIYSLTNAHTYHYDFIIDRDIRPDAVSCFLQLLRRAVPRRMHMRFEHMPASSGNFISLTDAVRAGGSPFYRYSQPWAPWMESSGDWNVFYDNLPGRLKNTLRRYRKKAEAIGTLSFEVIERSGDLDAVLNVVFDIEYKSWKGREGTAIKCCPEVESFYRKLACWAMKQGHLLLFILKLNDTPIAADFCLSSGQTVFLLKSGYNEEFHYLSPGNLLCHELFGHLFRNPGMLVYNFLGACEPWKMEWTDKTHAYGSIRIYPKSLEGWGRYAFRYGWREYLKKFQVIRQCKAWIDRKKSGK